MTKLIFLIGCMFSLLSWGGPTVKENGAGLLELRFVSVWEKREEIIKPCRVGSLCQLSDIEKAWLAKIQQKSHQEKKLVFSSALKNPEPYLSLSSETSVIGTEAQVGAQIFVNLDALSLRPASESFEFPIMKLMSAWLYHHGLSWRQSAELSKKVAKFWTQKLTAYNLIPYGIKKAELQIFSGDELSVFVSDSDKTKELTPVLLEKLHCSESFRGRSIESIQKATWEVSTRSSVHALTLFAGQIQYSCRSLTSNKTESWIGIINLWIDFSSTESAVPSAPTLSFEGAKVRFQNLRQK